MAIGMAVITGALVTGDSVRQGLKDLVGIRLGDADLSVTAGDRFVTDFLADRMSERLGIPATAVLQLEGSAAAGGGTKRIPKVQVFGVESGFRGVLGPATFGMPVNDNEAVISDNLATRLGVKEGDEILIRIKKPGPVPIDAPFVSDADQIITASIIIKAIAGKEQHGRFHLQNVQSAPFNLFISKRYLQNLTDLKGLSNLILLSGNSTVSAQEAEQALTDSRTLADAGIYLDKHPATGEWILRTPRVFLDAPTLSAIESLNIDKTLWFSYFVNEFRIGDRTTPYSFVSTLPNDQVRPGEILINRWLADDLHASPGDSVTLTYYMVGPLRNLTVENRRFLVKTIIPTDDPRYDRLLMPEIPGLSDAGNCRDWETSIPVDLSMIRDKDEEYWNQYRGTPKAFIHPGVAAAMWQNRFGSYTQVRFPPETDSSQIITGILSHLRPSDTGIRVRESAREGLAAASSGTDFSGLFLGLSFFLIAGGIILTVLLIRLGLESRLAQIGTLRATGWPEKRIRQMLLWENSLVACIGAVIGLTLTFVYSILIFKALNGVWNDIVLTDTLRPVFKPETLVAGLIISILVSTATAWFTLTRFFHRNLSALQNKTKPKQSIRTRNTLTILSFSFLLIPFSFAIVGLINSESIGPAFFFLAGTLMLAGFIFLSVRLVRYQNPPSSGILTLGSLGRSNLWRNSSRSLSVILLFAIGVFMVIAIGANRKQEEGHKGTRAQEHEGTGGFLFYLETTVPVPDNLNKPEIRVKYALETEAGFVQMKKREGDDASCLNLNRVSNPPLLGVPAGALAGRFRFASVADREFEDHPWKILEQELPGGAIPVIADQTVIQWGLGMKLGDTLKYPSERGDTVSLVLVGGMANSVFQGHILISENQFIRNWPSISGTNVILVSADPADLDQVQTDILRVFRDYGCDLKPAAEKLAEFNSIENTYLSIFLVMGALAMLLGTIGLGIILVRNLQERRAEIALLRATGFSKSKILSLVTREYAALLVYGTLAGGIPGLVCILPGLLNPAGEVSGWFLLAILLVLFANGLIWILLLGWNAIGKKELIQSLMSDE